MNRLLPISLVVIAVGLLAWAAIQAGGSSSSGEPDKPPAEEPVRPPPGPSDPVPAEDTGPVDGTTPDTTGSEGTERPVRVPNLDEIRELIEGGRREDALGGLDRLLKAEPDNHEARLLRARTYRSLNWNRLAETDFREVLARGKETAPLLEDLADVLQAARRDEAQRLLLRAVELAPNRSRPHSMLARIHLRSGRTKEAKDEVERALTLDPTDPLAVALMQQMER